MILYLSLTLNAIFLAGLVAAVAYVWPGLQAVQRARILLG